MKISEFGSIFARILDKILGGQFSYLRYPIPEKSDVIYLVLKDNTLESEFYWIGGEIVKVDKNLEPGFVIDEDGNEVLVYGRRVLERGLLSTRIRDHRKDEIVIAFGLDEMDFNRFRNQFFLNTAEGQYLNSLMEIYGWRRFEWMDDQTFRLWSFLFANTEKSTFQRNYEGLYFLFGAFLRGKAIITEDPRYPYRVIIWLDVPYKFSDGYGYPNNENNPEVINKKLPTFEIPEEFHNFWNYSIIGEGFSSPAEIGSIGSGQFYGSIGYTGEYDISVFYPKQSEPEYEILKGVISGNPSELLQYNNVPMTYFIKLTGRNVGDETISRSQAYPSFSYNTSFTEPNNYMFISAHDNFPQNTNRTDIFYFMFYDMKDLRPAGIGYLFLNYHS